MVENLPAMRKTWVRSLGWEDPLEKRKTTQSSILAWRIPWTVHGAAKSRTRLSDFYFTSLHFTTTRILSWLLSRYSDHHRLLMLLFYNHSNFLPWRRQWHPTPVLVPGKVRGRRSLVGCRLWGCTESTRLKRLSSSSSKLPSLCMPILNHEYVLHSRDFVVSRILHKWNLTVSDLLRLSFFT